MISVFGTAPTVGRMAVQMAGRMRAGIAPGGGLRDFFQSEALSWLFVFKTALAALIALWLAYRLEFESPSTAVVTVFIVMQARTGMVLAKGFYRALGTVIGCIVALMLVAEFSQARILFLIGLGLWVGLCTAGATLYRNFQSYAFVLAGYTACLVGLPAALDPSHAFEIGVTRVSEVLLGILVASVVSGLVFPLSTRELLLRTARNRFGAFSAAAARVLDAGISRKAWGRLHLDAINDMTALDGYRSVGVFDNRQTRVQNQIIRRMNADLMSAASTLNLLNSYLLRLNTARMFPVRQALAPLLAEGRCALGAEGGDGHAAREAHLMAPALRQWHRSIEAAQVAYLPTSESADIESAPRYIDPGRIDPGLVDPGFVYRWHIDQHLAWATAVALLGRFAVEFLRYVASHDALQQGRMAADESAHGGAGGRPDAPPIRWAGWHRTDIAQPLAAAFRSIITLAVMSAFWIGTAWPSGPAAVTIAVVISALFATLPNPVLAVHQMWMGIAAAVAAAFVFQFLILTQLNGFALLALGLLPFLLIGPYLLTRPRWAGMGMGFGLFFAILAIPGNRTVFDYAGLINNGIGQLLAVAVAGLSFLLIMPAGNGLTRARMLRALNLQMVAACRQPLPGLRQAFERDTRELLRQIASIPGLKPAQNTMALRKAMHIQELGRAILALRAAHGDPLENPMRGDLPAATDAAIALAIERMAAFYQAPDRAGWRAVRQAFATAYAQACLTQADSEADSGACSRERQVLIYLNVIRSLLGFMPEIGVAETRQGGRRDGS